MHPHRTSAPSRGQHTPPMEPVLALYATTFIAAGVAFDARLHIQLTARIRKYGAEVVAAQTHEVCTRIADGRDG